MTKYTPKERVMAALRGGRADKVPFTAYEDYAPRCSAELELRNRGLCLVRRTESYKIHRPDVNEETHIYCDELGRDVTKTVYTTPHGKLSTLEETRYSMGWTREHLFKSPDDYKSLLFYINNTIIEPNYDTISRLVSDLGDDYAVRDRLPREPLQMIVSGYMDIETYCIEWMENRDEVLKLYDALVKAARKIYKVIADGPLEFCNYGGNVMPKVIGVENFRKYYIPNYNEAAEILHKKGKLIGTHLDDDNTPIMAAVAETDLDYIEAFDPGMGPSVSDAFKTWPDKVLWINWPSAWHLRTEDEVRQSTVELIEDAGTGEGFIIGITEDVPVERWKGNFKAIMDGIDIKRFSG